MTTREAIGIIARQLKEEMVIGTTGYTCRDLQALRDRARNFYMMGSMGLAASIGLGVALAKPDQKVLIFDGDGAILMGLGNLIMIGSLKPINLIHLVLDNEGFASTGNQPTYSRSVSLDAVAQASGYPVVRRTESPQELASLWQEMRALSGPAFLLVKCRPDDGPAMERIRLEPEAITRRFMASQISSHNESEVS